MKVRARGKSRDTPYPIWIYGEYITKPPIRPKDGVIRPIGHYIDKGGYPGANVYEINMDTFGRDTGSVDKQEHSIFEKDILLWENEEEISYLVVEEHGQVIDIVSGKNLEVQQLDKEHIKIIGNVIDANDFVESIRYCIEKGKPIPYIPCINVQTTGYPYMLLSCETCKKKSLSCKYMGKCKDCGGFLTVEYTTKVYQEKEKAFA